MVKFLAGADLSEAIRTVCAGQDVRCAVAFWGRGSESLFNEKNPQPWIFCDITLGGTSPEALRALGAPDNESLRHVRGLHAKVYLSERGAVIGSANASQNGVGFDKLATLTESGVFISTENDQYKETERWIEGLMVASEPIDKDALDLAKRSFRPTKPVGSQKTREGSLLDLVAASPDRFSDVSFVFASSASTSDDRRLARESLLRANSKETEAINALPDHGMFTGWDQKDLNRWRRAFFEFWMPDKTLKVFGRTVAYFDDVEGNVMTKRDWRAVRGCIPGKLPTAGSIEKTDGAISKKIIEKYGNVLFTALDLAREIEMNSEQ